MTVYRPEYLASLPPIPLLSSLAEAEDWLRALRPESRENA